MMLLCVGSVVFDDFLDTGYITFIICVFNTIFILLAFIGIYYKISGKALIVYSFFIPKAYPIDKIKEIKPTKSVLSSPAASLKYRLAITFTDKLILKSNDPLIISPVRQDEFIARLSAINPNIKYSDCEK